MNLAAAHSSISPILANNRSGLADPNWRAAMADEYKVLIHNGTWRLFPRPSGANVVTGKWICKHKFHSDGTLAHHKAHWVVRGFSQQHGIDYDETLSPLSNWQRTRSSSALPPPAPGRFTSSTSRRPPGGDCLLPAASWLRRPHHP
jgi:hypothetical protein